MIIQWWRSATQKQRRRAVELGGTLILACFIAWQYGGLAPQVFIVLSWWLSLFTVLVQMPFVAGFYGVRRIRPVLAASLLALPFVIARGYETVYGTDLFLIWYGEWLGGLRPAAAVPLIIALPALSFLAGLMSRKMRRS